MMSVEIELMQFEMHPNIAKIEWCPNVFFSFCFSLDSGIATFLGNESFLTCIRMPGPYNEWSMFIKYKNKKKEVIFVFVIENVTITIEELSGRYSFPY